MAHDIAWQQEERQDAEPMGKVCGGCGEELTAADIEYGAEDSEEDPCGYGYMAYFPICIKCAGGERDMCGLCGAELQAQEIDQDVQAEVREGVWETVCGKCATEHKAGVTFFFPSKTR
jgi:uncharacterized CHY-type Zn-finger protein